MANAFSKTYSSKELSSFLYSIVTLVILFAVLGSKINVLSKNQKTPNSDAKNLIEEYGEPIVPGCETTFDEVEKFAIGYLLDSVKSEIRNTMKDLSV